MKKLFGILLVLAVAMIFALPALATEEAPDFKVVNTNIDATALKTFEMQDEIYDEETKEFIGMGPKWTYYDWTKYTYVEVQCEGETYNMCLDQLGVFYADRYGWNFGGGIMDGQSAETPWEVGGTYDVYYYIFDHESKENDGIVWDVNLKVTLTEGENKIQISDIIVDEFTGWMEQDKDGNPYRHYYWDKVGILNATIEGTEYKNIRFWELQDILCEKYGKLRMSSYYLDQDLRNPDDQMNDPWKPGDTFQLHVEISGEKEFLFEGVITIKVTESNIESITAAPMIYYAHRGTGMVELTSHYKDGTSGPCLLESWYFTAPAPDEPGTYTATIRVADAFEVPVQITVLPTPTSGKLGENVTWTFDETTKTLTVSGTGDTYFADVTQDNFTEEFNEFSDEWTALIVHFLPKKVVVEEGITGMLPGFMMYAPSVEEFSLPNSLKNLPLAFFGYNGPSSVVDTGVGETEGVSTFIVPQSVTAWDALTFYQCWGIKDIYIPAGVQSINLENLVQMAWIRNMIGAETISVTVHFAGSEAQWNAINFFVPTELTGPGTGLTLDDANALMKTVTVVFDDPSETYEKILVDNGTVTIPEDIVKVEEGKDVVIDVTDTEEEVSSVVIGTEIVDKLADAETKVEIKLPEVTVSFDKAAIGSIGQQATDKDVTIVATEVKQEDLKTEQKAALEEKAVYTVLNLEAKAGDEKITEFGGGKVTISVEFQLPEGTIGTDFVVAYVADDGTITLMPTTYADGVLSFETTHFSNYVVLAVSDNPKTGDTSMSAVVALLVLSGAACVTLCANKRRIF